MSVRKCTMQASEEGPRTSTSARSLPSPCRRAVQDRLGSRRRADGLRTTADGVVQTQVQQTAQLPSRAVAEAGHQSWQLPRPPTYTAISTPRTRPHGKSGPWAGDRPPGAAPKSTPEPQALDAVCRGSRFGGSSSPHGGDSRPQLCAGLDLAGGVNIRNEEGSERARPGVAPPLHAVGHLLPGPGQKLGEVLSRARLRKLRARERPGEDAAVSWNETGAALSRGPAAYPCDASRSKPPDWRRRLSSQAFPSA